MTTTQAERKQANQRVAVADADLIAYAIWNSRYTYREIARRVGLPLTSVARLATGQARTVQAEAAARLATTLEMPQSLAFNTDRKEI